MGILATTLLYNNEILPPEGVGIARAAGWITTGLVGFIGPFAIEYLGSQFVLAFLAVCCFLLYWIIDKFCIEPSELTSLGHAEISEGEIELVKANER